MNNKAMRLFLALMAFPFVVHIAQAASNIMSTKVTAAIDQTTPGTTNKVSIGTDGTVTINSLPSGSALVGKVGIDQTTDGTTNKVYVGNSIVAGSALIGKVGLDQTTPGTTNKVSLGSDIVSVKIDQTTDGTTNKVYIGGNAGTALPVTMTSATSTPVVTKVGSTGTSGQLIAANATRKGLEIDADCANTDDVAINFGATAAVYASHKILKPCTNWEAPPGVVVISAVQVISNSGTQQVRVIEYP